MKHLLITGVLALSTLFINAQTVTKTINATEPSINVNGTAEMEVVPDEIYVNIQLKEYKKGSSKVDIQGIKNEFLAKAKKLGYTEKEIFVYSYDGWDGNAVWYNKKKKQNDLLAGITYQVKLSSTQKMDELVNILDDAATTNFYIAKTSHSKIEEYKKQLKIEALKAAKAKAEYLAAALGEKVGRPITISEPDAVNMYQPMYANVRFDSAAGESAPISADFKKLKLSFSVTATFALVQ